MSIESSSGIENEVNRNTIIVLVGVLMEFINDQPAFLYYKMSIFVKTRDMVYGGLPFWVT